MNDEYKHGDVLIYKDKTLFMFDKYDERNPKLINGILYSGTTYLESGWFAHPIYAASCCRRATEAETTQYKELIQSSRYSKNLGVMDLFQH
jgi:hypothetical protein